MGWTKTLVARGLTAPGVNRVVKAVAPLLLPDNKLHRLPVADREARYRLQSGEDVILLDPFRDQIAKDIVWGHGKPTSSADARVLRLVERWAHSATTFLDIGAYSGLFAMITAKTNPQIRSVAFDLLPENYMMINSNIIRNDLVERVDVRLCGLADKTDTAIMPADCRTTSHPSSVNLGLTFTEGVSVPVRTLDSFGFDGRLAMKLDVEGFEWKVIKGARETIAKHKPRMICEILRHFKHGEELQASLEGYRFFISLADGFEERREIRPDARGRDWVFTASELPQDI